MTIRLFLPGLRTTNPPPPPVSPLGQAEGDLWWEVAHHPEQKRLMLRPHHVLMVVAQRRAADMAMRGELSHVDPAGYGPNYYVRQAGFVLPDFYQKNDDANNIESAAAGQATAREVIAGWKQSPGHWRHVTAWPEKSMYRAQVLCGIGYAYNADARRYGHFWVLITAPLS